MTARSTQETVRTVDVGSYSVHIGSGLRRHVATYVSGAAPAHRYAVITDDNVRPLYADDLVAQLSPLGAVSLHVVPAGEANKTREQWARVTDEMLQAGCARDTAVIALGGGVVGDLAGFVAATFMRGVPVVQCPTTLLAMIDASVGGKTGVDTAAGKNLVGVFHPPAVVLADIDVLRTLSLAQRRSGLAEAIKHGVIADANYFADLSATIQAVLAGDAGAMLHAVARSVEIKAEIVKSDLREHGRRKTLNFGHTIGHAIEQATGYALLHGECVAIGMVIEARIAERLGVASNGTSDAIVQVLERAGLPTARPRTIDPAVVLSATRSDKKSRAGAVEYALPVGIGAMMEADSAWSTPVDDSLVMQELA
jgi:3-dehydroquinate synthase